MRQTVLSVNQHTATQITTNLILERAGYRVLSTRDLEEAIRLFEISAIDAVVIGDSISAHNRMELGKKFRELKHPVPIVMLCKMNDSRALREIADAQVESEHGPELLLEALERVLGCP